MSAKALVVWDLDGTLADTRDDLALAANQARTAIGRPELARSEVISFVGEGLLRLIERLTPEADDATRARALRAFEDAYDGLCTRAPLAYPGIIEAVARLAERGVAQAVATNKPARFALRITAHLGFDRALVGIRAGSRRKPDPWMIRSLADEAEVPLTATWMAGDHHADLEAAAAAPCRSAFCTWGFGRRESRPADMVAATPAEVVAAVLG